MEGKKRLLLLMFIRKTTPSVETLLVEIGKKEDRRSEPRLAKEECKLYHSIARHFKLNCECTFMYKCKQCNGT